VRALRGDGGELIMADPRDERIDASTCADCGAPIEADSERAFGFGTGNVLCASCAARRGGRYDAERDVWHVEPDLAGLDDEAYGASPHERSRRRPAS
jgi:hypothetical protein